MEHFVTVFLDERTAAEFEHRFRHRNFMLKFGLRDSLTGALDCQESARTCPSHRTGTSSFER
jgi:hypothetical protein